MEITTPEAVEAIAAEFDNPGADELEPVEPMTDEDDSELPELSIEELEAMFSDLN
jgi:hypothetical protein